MAKNLIAELIKTGIKPTEVTDEVAKCIRKSRKTVYAKLYKNVAFKVDEALAIVDHFFNGEGDIRYLFQTSQN